MTDILRAALEAEHPELVGCGHCGGIVPAKELKPMPHSPGIQACKRCLTAIAVVGHHQKPIDPRLGYDREIKRRLGNG